MKKLILLSAMLVSSFALANSNQVDRLDSVFEAPCYKTTTTTTSNPDGSTTTITVTEPVPCPKPVKITIIME